MSPSGNGAISFPDYERVEKQVVSLLSVVAVLVTLEDWAASPLSVVSLKIGKNNCKPGPIASSSCNTCCQQVRTLP